MNILLRWFGFFLMLLFVGQAALAASDELVIGQVVSMSRNGGDIGRAMQAGQNAYFQHINAQGGINGKKLRLVTLDDQYIPEETVRLTKQLIAQENPIALAGFRGTANGLALVGQNILTDNQIALVGSFTGALQLRSAPYFFHTRSTFDDELEALAKVARQTNSTQIAVFYQDDAFGLAGIKAFEELSKRYGLTIVARASYDKAPERAKATVDAAVQTVLKSSPQLVIVIAVADQTYDFFKGLRSANFFKPIYSLSVVSPKRAVELLGVETARGLAFSQVFPYPFSGVLPMQREYRNLMQKYAPQEELSYFSMEGYVNAKVLVEAIRRAGNNPTRQRVAEILSHLGRFDLGGFDITFAPGNRQGSHYTELTVLSGKGTLLR